jgi:hypothetical protein
MSKHKTLLGIGISLVVIGSVFLAYQVYITNRAHTTFERYYAFRGCTQLIDRTDTYGDCKTAGGQTIKIVLINGKCYLDGDGPGVW